jgi:AraC family transcriptional regulator of adaptative response/methylated-DNA-[protein]-cysteine methyltransferase
MHRSIVEEELYWRAVERRDREFDGRFYFGVATTGVFCRPSCKCRLPLRKNVRYFASAEEALAAGFRACLRCRPLEAADQSAEIAAVRKAIEFMRSHWEETPALEEIARHVGMSPFHFQRRFKAAVGVTPRQYLEACRLEALRGELRRGNSVTDAIYAAGFGSASRVYERVDTRLGMTPAQYRQGGRGVSISYATAECALGRLMIGATDRGLCFVQFGDTDSELLEMLEREYPAARITPMGDDYPEQFRNWMRALRAHLDGTRPSLDLPLDVRATAFQMKVWRYLQSIPYADVQSYSEVAAGIGQPAAARAVARACARNPVALVIPCHRVIRGTGELGGYRWGVERKRALIDNERRARAGAL